jgi:hypothetical protein
MTGALRISLAGIFVTTLSSVATAQKSVEFDIGVRGGLFTGGPPLEVFSSNKWPPNYTTDEMPYTFGPTLGLLFNDRFEIRFEAVRSQFRFHSESTEPYPTSGRKSTSTTDGHMWQYPLLVTFHSSSGPVRPLIGGGIGLPGSVHGTTSTTLTTITPPTPSGVVTTTFSTRPFQSPTDQFGFYITGGVDGRVSFLSIRPELRYAHWSSSQKDPYNQLLYSSNQLEFLVGVTLHPFRSKSRVP